MIVVSGIRIPLEAGLNDAVERACALLGISGGQIADCGLRHVSYDARHNRVSIVCSVFMTLKDEGIECKLCNSIPSVSLIRKTELKPKPGEEPLAARPVIAGFGPAGMFAAYLLSIYGYRPIVVERGGDMDSRVETVGRFFADGILDESSNVQFGEGGAGTFSDGKLTTRINDPLCDFVTETFLKFGAPKDIAVKAKPHIGTDKLRGVVKALREDIIKNGGEVRFNSRLDGLTVKNGTLYSVSVNGEEIRTGVAVIACGHSARDTFSVASDAGLTLEAKPFSVGVRIEHLQSEVNRLMYKEAFGNPLLPNADYNFAAHYKDKGVYTFCMCPGGFVVPAASETGGVVTNGMSNYLRNGKNSNSALVVSVGEKEFGKNPFEAIEFQRRLERAAFVSGGRSYRAPAQDAGSFLNKRAGLKIKTVEPTYSLGVTPCDFEQLLGAETADALRFGISEFGKKAEFFRSRDAILTGIETRTSSPVRILRNENGCADRVSGVYPCGEGAGYAGGIMSAAVDGLKTAVKIIERWKP